MVGITGGVSTITGGSYFYFANQIQTFAPGLEVMVFHPSWFTVIGDFSAALESKQEMKTPGGSGFAVEGSAWYADILAGARHASGSGAFIYLAAGVALSGGESTTTFLDSDGTSDSIKADVGTTVGLSLGAGGAVPVGDRLRVFLKFRHRLVVGEADLTEPGDSTETATVDFDLGGLETAVGVGFTF
jgi:opacity protein-like surface antigen